MSLRRPSLALIVLTLIGCEGPDDSSPPPAPAVRFLAPTCDGPLKPTTHAVIAEVEADPATTTVELALLGPGGPATVPVRWGEAPTVEAEVDLDSQGTWALVLTATDGWGQKGTADLTCLVQNAAPAGQIVEPEGASTYTEEDTFTLVVQVDDPDDAPETLDVAWSSSLDGPLGSVTPDATGRASLTVSGLSVYNHLLTVQATDAWGGMWESSLLVEITECRDRDADGHTDCSEDCDDFDPTVNSGAPEVCNGKDDDCNTSVDELGDTDGDTQPACVPGCAPGSACVLDCDDTDPTISPLSIERCDNRDNNCDGETDEGYDADHDGATTCASPADCNDRDPTIGPQATEVCDRVDQDCDGAVDEDLAVIWYRDNDRDGAGDPGVTQSVCGDAQPPGFVANADDCDDTDASVHPDGIETCDGRDEDCDGAIDEGFTPSAFYVDADGDTHGDPTRPVEACALPPGASADDDDCDDTTASISPDAPEVCDTLDQDCDGVADEGVQIPLYRDRDADGWGNSAEEGLGCAAAGDRVERGGDCDDADPGRYPTAPEVCDGIDQDCDTLVDDGATTTFYPDADGDTFGDDTTEIEACEAPAGTSPTPGDCDDRAPAVNPAAAETCNSRDDDCDGVDDEGVKTPFYLDGDGDGVGVEGAVLFACTAPAGYAAEAGDCDDAAPTVYPGAPEACDGIDNTCDGALDEGLPQQSFFTDADGDGYGDDTQSVEACAPPPGTVDQGGDCRDGNAAIHPGVAETCNAKDDDCDGETDEGVKTTFWVDADVDTYGDPARPRQACTLCAGCAANDDDCNDGRADVHPGAPERFDGVDNNCDGKVETTVALSTADGIFTGTQAGGATGAAIVGLGDLDNDGLGDLAFSAPKQDSRKGVVYVFYGRARWGNLSAGQAETQLNGGVAEVEAGTSLGALDLNNDGAPDLAVGVPRYDGSTGTLIDAGKVSVLYGGKRLTSGALSQVESLAVGGRLPQQKVGWALGAEDVGCDGLVDLLIGAPWDVATQVPNSYGGAVFVLPGKAGPRPGGIGSGDLLQIFGDTNDVLGLAVAGIGDIDGDGCGDLLAAGKGALGSGPQAVKDIGVVYVIGGGEDLVAGQSVEAPDTAASTWEGSRAGDRVGAWSAGLGDINGDGAPDVGLGRIAGAAGTPLMYVVYGGAPLPASGSIDSRADVAVRSGAGLTCPCVVAGLGDVNSDGAADWALGVPGATGGGKVFVFFGQETAYPAALVAERDAAVVFTAEGATDGLGSSIVGVGDVNGDGRMDLAVGAPGASSGGNAVGKVYLVLGY